MKKVTRNLIITAGALLATGYVLKKSIKNRNNQQEMEQDSNYANEKNVIFPDYVLTSEIYDLVKNNPSLLYKNNQKEKSNDMVDSNTTPERKYFSIPRQKVKTSSEYTDKENKAI